MIGTKERHKKEKRRAIRSGEGGNNKKTRYKVERNINKSTEWKENG